MEGISLHLYVEQGDIAVLEDYGGDTVDVSHDGATLRMAKTQFNERYTKLPKQEKGQYIPAMTTYLWNPAKSLQFAKLKKILSYRWILR